MLRNKRLNIAIAFTVLLAGVFWSQSRVPALNEKAQMGLRTDFGAIAFEIVLPVTAEQSLLERVGRSSINWVYTNWQGMSFGLLFAAAALTILGAMRRRSFRQAWLNTLFGAAAGAPLGVCVNCATPIAHGIYAAGARLETALSTLLASPTLNAIVLTMSFALLPWELAFAKLAGVVLLLASIPLLVRLFAPERGLRQATAAVGSTGGSPFTSMPTGSVAIESYARALRECAVSYFRHLWYIVRVAVPLMLLAGVLGAVVIEVVPFDALADANASAAVVVAGAVLATFLPVPIAFDVIVVSALLSRGADIGIAAALLFGLGAFSIYPAFVIARFVSLRLSLALSASVVILASALGFGAQIYFERQVGIEREIIVQGLANANQSSYSEAIAICERLPATLHQTCFAQQLERFSELLGAETLCEVRPQNVARASCEILLQETTVRQQAVAAKDPNVCASLPETRGTRQRCFFEAVTQSALGIHDIALCSELRDPALIDACRTQYVTASLMFNPDDSVCVGLSGAEYADCRSNAEIYRLADTMHFAGCDRLSPDDLQEFCRYVIASSMIGRRNDPSGCARVRSPDLADRCRSQVTAWQATRERSFERCQMLRADDLRSTCLLRVAAEQTEAILSQRTLVPAVSTLSAGAVTLIDDFRPMPADPAPPIEWTTLQDMDGVEIAFANNRERAVTGSNGFNRVAGQDLGITRAWQFRATDFFEPFIIGKGIASGDFNGDLWPDLALATEAGVAIYQNIGGSFALVAADQGVLGEQNLFLVAFFDADNDGRQDLFASAYGGRNFVLINSGEGFVGSQLIEIAGERRLTLAAGFGDLDLNGELDIVLGNWTSGVEMLFAPAQSGNEILYRQGDGYIATPLEEIRGETNSVLLADINGDLTTDILIGNDRIVPDMYYLNRGPGELVPISVASGIVPVTSMFTMSLELADFNNDLRPDIFSTDMTFARSSRADYCGAVEDRIAREYCEDILRVYSSFQDSNPVVCADRSTAVERQECFAAFAIKAAKTVKDAQYCDGLPGQASAQVSLCRYLSQPVPAEEAIDQSEFLRQTQRNGLLLNEGGRFSDAGIDLGVASSFWSWNAKAADLDNDEWQDIYVGNGFHFGDDFYEIQENVAFRNIEGGGFESVGADWGLNDPINTPSYTYIDFDLDGDVDIVSTGVLAPPRVFVNQAEGNSVTFVLADAVGNSAAIGATVTITYAGAARRQQRKEILLSGGFMSFNNPVAHFGLGVYDTIELLEIRWPDGESTVYRQPLAANGFYRIRRRTLP